jgi:ribose transport system permease protein
MHRSAFILLKWLGFFLAAVVAAVSAIMGSLEDVPTQHVMLYSIAIFAGILWGWHHITVRWTWQPTSNIKTEVNSVVGEPPLGTAISNDLDSQESGDSYIGSLINSNKALLITAILMIVLFMAVAFAVDGFLQWRNILAVVILLLLLALTVLINKNVKNNKSGLMGTTVLIGLFIIGTLVVEGFLSTLNLKSMLLFAAFLGLACIGQTLVALLGGLDLSIPFVIGSSNIGLMYLFNLGLPPWICIITILLAGSAIGFINGVLSFRLQGQALILTLGVGFAVSGGTQILTTIGSSFGGNVFGVVPQWLSNIAATNGSIAGIQIPPVILIWILLAIGLTLGLRHTTWGRSLYALGGGRTASARLLISERAYWIGVYTISGLLSALTGSLLLGWSGGGFIGVGDQYLFMTLAAVVVGGTSLLGGWGGYGFTVIGVLVLQVLTSFLVGIGLSYEGQQFVFGLLILPMVALYARSPHIRTQI